MNAVTEERCKIYLFYVFSFFMAGFYFLPAFVHKNFFYFIVAIPFLFMLPRINWRRLLHSRILTISLIYIAFTAISSLWSGRDLLEMSLVFRHALVLGVYLLISAYIFSSMKGRLTLFYKILCSIAGIAGIGTILWFYFLSPHAAPLMVRLRGPEQIDHPNLGAPLFGIIALICHFGLLAKKDLKLQWRLWFFAIMAISISYVLLTQSRGPFIAFLAAITIGVLFKKDKRIIFSGGVVAAGFLLCFFSGLYDPMERGPSGRLNIWGHALKMIREHPLLGTGPRVDSFDIPYGKTFVQHAHNIYLNNAVETGLLGLSLLILLLIFVFRNSINEYRREGNVLPLVLLVLFCVAGLFDGGTLVRSPHYQWVHFWFPVSLAIGYELSRGREEVTEYSKSQERSESPSYEEGICHGNAD